MGSTEGNEPARGAARLVHKGVSMVVRGPVGISVASQGPAWAAAQGLSLDHGLGSDSEYKGPGQALLAPD